MRADKIAVIEPSDGETTIIRGTGIITILGQFTAWAEKHRRGAVILTDKIPIATRALQAAGYVVRTADDDEPPPAEPPRSRRMPLPLPECRHCHAPYRREHTVRAGEVCTECGHPLVLEQHDPNVLDGDAPADKCPECGRNVRRGWNFCPCGAELNTPQLRTDDGDRRPWHQRYADDLAQSRSAHLRGLVADLFAMPEGTDQ